MNYDPDVRKAKAEGDAVQRIRRTLLKKRRWHYLALLLVALESMCLPRPSVAEKPLQSYHHSSWNSEEGLGAVFDVQQAPDGYLWLTTSRGVFRFDGVLFQSIDEATGGSASNRDLDSVFVSQSGGIWLTTRTAGMLLWKSGTLTTYPDRRCTPSLKTDGVVEGKDGSLWLQTRSGLAHLHGSTCDLIGKERGYPGGFVAALLVDHRGTLWVETKSGALLFLPANEVTLRKASYGTKPTIDYVFLHEAPDGSIWLSDETGLRRVTDKDGLPSLSSWNHENNSLKTEFGNFIFASDGTLWAGTSKGLSHFDHTSRWPLYKSLNADDAESFSPRQGLTSDGIWKVLIDREGSIWVASNGGLDQLRRTPLTALVLPHTQETQLGVATGSSGTIWIGSRTLPLTRVTADGKFTPFPNIRLITSILEDREGGIWAGGGGDAHLWHLVGDRFQVVRYPGEYEAGISSLALDRNDELWLLLFGGNTLHLKNGTWSNESATLGRKPGVLGAMAGDAIGNVWIAFSNHLVRWNGKSYDRFSFPDGVMNISVQTLTVRDDRVWFGGEGGVLLFHQGRFDLMRWRNPDLPGRVTGLVETETGDLWMNGYSGVTHVPPEQLSRWLHDPSYPVSAEHFDALDGLPGLAGNRTPEPSLVESREGRLWFATTKSVAWAEPTMLDRLRNRIAPPVEITSISSNGKTYPTLAGLKLPARTDKLEIDFTALSLLMPERVLFRYRLDGVDDTWQESGTRRQAFYTNLAPGTYQFHVTACNNDGVWNDIGTIFTFAIAPTYYQTTWFRVLCALMIGALIWWMLRIRIRSVTNQLRLRLTERLVERERIARELHDTLLQSLFGLMLQFQAAAGRLEPNDPAREALNRALSQSDRVMNEGRERVKNLRTSQVDGTMLTDAITNIGQQLESLSRARFVLEVKGRARPIEALIQEEIILIAREALSNAFTHAEASTVRVEISYLSSGLHCAIVDNGGGMAESILKAGHRRDHWGLPGMRERANKIRASFELKVPRDGGTVVLLRVPAAIVYSRQSPLLKRLWISLSHAKSHSRAGDSGLEDID